MANPHGRPKAVGEKELQLLKEAFLLGCTDEEACHAAGIGKSTLYNYQNANPSFLEEKKAAKKNPVYLARKKMLELIDHPDAQVSFKAATDTLNRYDGKPTERVEMKSEVSVVEMSDEEIDRKLREIVTAQTVGDEDVQEEA